MSTTVDLNIQALRTLSKTLSTNIVTAELEARRSKEQLDSLLFSKELVDESIKTLISGSGISTCHVAAQHTLYPSGNMALPFCEEFNHTPDGSSRSLLASQIQTTIQGG